MPSASTSELNRAYVAKCEGGTGGPCTQPDCEVCWPVNPPTKSAGVSMTDVRSSNLDAFRDRIDAHFGPPKEGQLKTPYFLHETEWLELRKAFASSDETTAKHALPEYTVAIGDAGDAYLKSVSLDGRYHLSGTFRWYELWDAMCKAASQGAA